MNLVSKWLIECVNEKILDFPMGHNLFHVEADPT